MPEDAELSLEERVAALRAGATKELAEELLHEVKAWRELSDRFEARAQIAEAWRAGVEHATRITGRDER
jgi:hypothetical protein